MAILMPYWGLDVAAVLFFALFAAYLYMIRNFNYWLTRGVTEIRPLPFFGNYLDCCLFRKTLGEHYASMYKRGTGLPYLGFYLFDKPALLLRDPDIIRNVLVKNFDSFTNRHVRTHESDPVAYGNPFVTRTPHWRLTRHGMSPVFTTGKLKGMFPLMLDIGNNLVTHLDSLHLQGDGRVIEVKDISARYTTDLICSCAFGLEVDSLNDPKSLFREYGAEMFGFRTYKRGVEFATFFLAPDVAKLLNFKFFAESATQFMRNIVNDAIALRIETNVHRNDLIDVLVDLKKAQKHTDVVDSGDFILDGDTLVGIAASFFAAGFETSATTMAFTLYELALNPKVQSKLREEIISALEEGGGELTYYMVMKLSYLDMVTSETLRKYPSLSFLDRDSNRDFKIPSTGLVIEKDTPVFISLLGLHYDPEYFPDPEKYDPERFSKENEENMRPGTYLPFGEGPRNCVGLRFGLLQSKLGVLKFILNHEITVCDKTPVTITFDPKATLLASKQQLLLNVRRIQTLD